MTPEALTLHEMCERFDVTPRTMRHYESLELLASFRNGRARLYDDKAQARLKLILRGRQFGFPLEELRQWLEIYDSEGRDAQLAAWVNMANNQLEALQAQKQDIEAAISYMRQLRDEAAWQLASKDECRLAQ